MARNGMTYEGRVFERRTGDKPRLIQPKRTEQGLIILDLVLVEQMREQVKRAKRDPDLKRFVDDPYNEGKGDDDWINTYADWHEITIFGDKAEALITNPDFGHTALLEIRGASYTVGGTFVGRDGVTRQRRRETIGDKYGDVTIKFARRDEEGREPLWDGISELPKPGGSGGGGGGQAREYGDDEGI